jgi:predicted metal-dependent enzyme (double-stranded beta helix superfamily)
MTDTSELQRFFAERIGDADMEPEAIERLAGELAGRTDLWRDQVSHSEDERVYVQLYRDHHLDAWLICWTGTQDTGLHDHDLSSGAVHVVDGALDEDRLRMAGGIATARFEAGGSFHFDASRIHDVRNAEGHTTVSLHLYSPPIWRMGYYEQGEDGSLARRSYSYAEELRT